MEISRCKKRGYMKKLIVFFIVIICLISFGCNKGTEPPKPAPPKEEAKPESLEDKVIRLQRELFALIIQVRNISDGTAVVSSEEKGYSIAPTRYGSFAVICNTVTPYLDGYKVKLDIGNLTSAQFNGAKIKLTWGKNFDNTKDISITTSFPPGRYTTIEVVMTPAKPEDIKEFMVTLDFNQIALTSSRSR